MQSQGGLSVQVESVSSIQRKLTVKVPAVRVAARVQREFETVRKTAKLKGFRPGHVPMNVVKQMYGAEVRHQAFHDLLDEAYREAIAGEKLRVVSRPKIDTPDHQTGDGAHDHTIDESRDFTFTAMVEVLPELEVKSYKGLALTRQSTEVTAKDVEKVVQGLRESQAELVAIEDDQHLVKKGDHVDLQFQGGLVTASGVEERAGMKGSRLLEVGSDALIPGFEDELVGLKRGETKTFRIPFPKDFHEAELAGKESEFTVTVNEIKMKRLPVLDDELAKTLGYESLADMEKKATDHLTKEKAVESERKLRSDLLAALIEKNKFDCPKALIETQTRSLAQEVGQNLKSQGFDEKMIQEALMQELPGLEKRAENQVRASLLVEAISKKEGIEVTEQDLEQEMAQMAESMKVDREKLVEFYGKNPSRKEDLDYRMREEKALKWVLEQAKIKNA